MNKILYIIFLMIVLISGASKTLVKDNGEAIAVENTEKENTIRGKLQLTPDLKLTEITSNDFQKYKANYNSSCRIDDKGAIAGTKLSIRNNCNEICETYLVESKTKKKLLLPSSFDQGIINILFSPSCTLFFVFSSYDGPDSVNYYAHRAEMIVFSLKPNGGLKSVKQSSAHDFDEFSIEDATWINDKTIALKVYEEAAGGDNSHLQFKYYKAEF